MRSASLIPRPFPPPVFFTDHTFTVNVFLVELISKPLALPVNDVPVMRTVAEWQKSGNQMKVSVLKSTCISSYCRLLHTFLYSLFTL